MASTPPQYTTMVDEPTIIIDPTLYLPSGPSRWDVVGDICVGAVQGVMVAALALTTMFSIAHVVKYQTLTHGLGPHAEQVAVAMQKIEETLTPMPAPVALASAGAILPVGAASSVVSLAAGEGDRKSIGVQTQPYTTPLPVPQVSSLALTPTAGDQAGAEGALESELDGRAELMSKVRLARRMIKVRHFDEAESTLREVLVARANHPAALSALARLHLAQGRTDEARDFAQRAVQVAPYQASYRLVLGDVLQARGDLPAAQSEWELAKRLDPNIKIEHADLPANPF